MGDVDERVRHSPKPAVANLSYKDLQKARGLDKKTKKAVRWGKASDHHMVTERSATASMAAAGRTARTSLDQSATADSVEMPVDSSIVYLGLGAVALFFMAYKMGAASSASAPVAFPVAAPTALPSVSALQAAREAARSTAQAMPK